MNLIAPVLVTIALLATSSTTLAGGGHSYGHYGYDGHRGGHHRGHHSYYPRRYRRTHRHHSYHGEYLVGGILLGSLIANSVHRAHNHPRYVERRVYQPARTVRTETINRRLLRDVNGDCFELYTAEDGSEVRDPIAREECSW
ncbi:MAG: hypothetical protein ACR2P1_00990 [Pseudomonadales bacterium]